VKSGALNSPGAGYPWLVENKRCERNGLQSNRIAILCPVHQDANGLVHGQTKGRPILKISAFSAVADQSNQNEDNYRPSFNLA
jgi:hypothetical protein